MGELRATNQAAHASVQDTAPRIAVLIPCHNEEAAIGKVIAAFARELPSAAIYVYDNNSTDRTIEVAQAAGAFVSVERLQGKGNVVRRMFSDIEADAYVLVDGDDTYEAASAVPMLDMLFTEGIDMVTGTRVTNIAAAYRRGHRFGNVMLTGIVRAIFGDRITDMLSGYRVFSRRFVKSFPALSSGFETETELTIHALELKMPLGELETPYRDRGEGSTSKLNTYKDGVRILATIVSLVKDQRPLQFFTIAGVILFVLGVGLSVPILIEFHRTHLVPRFPTAILSTGIVLLSFLSMVCGLVLDSVARGRKEAKRMTYLSIPASIIRQR
ncbi:glycosyltransferase family 2 protein [Granulicella mallensis]|uniref:Glycosyltransferase involved in cell wall biosynthesis n=1 Tax=Granulicella mallensis TaxID=940614 RepID=A0A7W8E930_9BACT|nr:glycosyltransferase family 2 protein [Granulicella mallensis]MBB5063169.1 glycosyltransferase involved in cell wall biosynthesis [Granulicella mallensis]